MYLFNIAYRNVFRNFRRTLLAGLSIMFAVMIVVYMWCFIQGLVTDVLDFFIKTSNGHIRVLNIDYTRREKMLPLETNIGDYKIVLQIAATNQEVVTAFPRIKFGVLMDAENKNKATLGIGIDPAKEEQVFNYSKKIVEGRMIEMGQKEINLGSILAKELGLKVGDTLTIVTQTAYGSIGAMNLKVVGIFSFGSVSYDKRTFFIPLDMAQELLDLSDKVTEVMIFIKDKNMARAVAKDIKTSLLKSGIKNLDVKAWQDQGAWYVWMQIAQYTYAFIYGFILVLASFTILNTMFMAVMERTKEIGVMKSMGMKDKQVIGVILLEAVIIGVAASFVGAILGGLIGYSLSITGVSLPTASVSNIDMPLPIKLYALFKWSFVITGFLLGVFLSFLAAIPPALKAAKMQPVESLREV
jgi:putative ABC transport system permease protein